MLRKGEATARLEGTREELCAILTDYDRYDAWMPGVELSRVLLREGDVAVAELKAPGWGTGYAFNLELVHTLPGSVEFHRIDCLDRRALTGRWDLGATDPGVGASTVEVRASLSLQTPLLDVGAGRRIRAALRAALDALGSRRRQLASAHPMAAAAKIKILEVVRGVDGLQVWYEGETYVLPRAPEDRGR